MSDVSRTLALRVTREELVLIFITMIWGGTFLVVHHAMAWSGPFFSSVCALPPLRSFSPFCFVARWQAPRGENWSLAH